ncbi:Myosin regulatory light chain 1 [Ceratocystis lukuohia]|uniref:Myosin regulatory light chain 1 n=1 Tax=Ceratocystis lukuohia TaxID=2019550 RepID=A0ABR4MQU9_9PEZI
MASPYRPSPLGYGSPARSSPFRRAESPASASAPGSPLRQITPSTSPTKQAGVTTPGPSISPRVLNSPFHTRTASASISASASTNGADREPGTPAARSTRNNSTSSIPFLNPHTQYSPFGTPSGTPASLPSAATAPGSPSPAPRALHLSAFGQSPGAASTTSAATASTATMTRKTVNAVSNANALSQLQPAQVRTLREGFQILDRDSDGFVNREDVADMLNQLGLPATPSDVVAFFPSSSPQTMSMAIFINTLASALAAMSPSTELLSAFSAFDDDDSGQIDLAELKDALLNTVPEAGERPLKETEIDQVINGFTARRAFSKKSMAAAGLGGLGKRNEVFKYQEFVNNGMINGGNSSSARDQEEEE